MSNQDGGFQSDFREEEASVLRKIIARRMTESKVTNPHFYLALDVDVEPLMSFREALIVDSGKKITYNDILMKGIATVLVGHPECNVSYVDEKIRYYKDVNICVAVAVKNGLLTPTVRRCQTKTITEISDETHELAKKARNMRLRPRESMGGTFTLSNLGMYGIEEFAAILNPPQAMILAVGAVRELPVVKESEIEIGHRMKLTISCDHKAVDGATAALFLSDLKKMLENPSGID